LNKKSYSFLYSVCFRQEKRKLNKPEFRSWFYVYKTAVEVEKTYADLLRDNYLMEVRDIDAPENELPSELADKRKPGVQQGASSTDEELPEIPFEKPSSTEKSTEEPQASSSAQPVQPTETEQQTPETPVQQLAPEAGTAKPVAEEVVQPATTQAVNSPQEQMITQTVSPSNVAVPASELLPPFEDRRPADPQPNMSEQQSEVSATQDNSKPEQAMVISQNEEQRVPPMPVEQHTVNSQEKDTSEEVKTGPEANVVEETVVAEQAGSEKSAESGEQLPVTVGNPAAAVQLHEAQPAGLEVR